MPRFFAAKPFTTPDGEQAQIGQEVPAASEWTTIESLISMGYLVASVTPEEVQEIIGTLGGGWLNVNSEKAAVVRKPATTTRKKTPAKKG